MKILVVGSGLSGATVARELVEHGHFVTVIDRRDHIGGNCFDYTNSYGIRVHKYGPHLFHTNDKEVYDYLGKFTTWIPYKHKVRARLSDGRSVVLPVNRETKKIVGSENVIDTFFRPYTKKMWGVSLEELDQSILNRVPIRDDDNEYYFPNDQYQGLPKDGYTNMIGKMLDHPNIKLFLNFEFYNDFQRNIDYTFYSGPIDEYYRYQHGHLPYRSVKLHLVDLPKNSLSRLPSPSLNFTDDGPYTRITEWSLLPEHGDNRYITSLTYEEPCDYRDNNMERFYPVKDLSGENKKLYLKYSSIRNDRTIFIGRCGTYQYLDMWNTVRTSLDLVREFLGR